MPVCTDPLGEANGCRLESDRTLLPSPEVVESRFFWARADYLRPFSPDLIVIFGKTSVKFRLAP